MSSRPPTARLLVFAVLWAVAATLVPSIGWAQAAPEWQTTEVSLDLYTFRWQGHNTVFLVTDDGVVAFDPIGVEPARQLAREIRRIAPDATLAAIVYSHSDADHATGARALLRAMGQSGAPIIAHENAVAPIRALSDPELPLPTVTFRERMTLRVGERVVELRYLGPSHTDNLIVPFFVDAGVAFAVDFVANDRMGYQELPGWHFPDFFDAVSGLLSIPFDTIVYGHGPPGDRASVLRQIAYYDDLTSAVRDAVARGWSEDQAAGEVRLSAYADWDRYEDWFPMNVRAVYRWLSKGG